MSEPAHQRRKKHFRNLTYGQQAHSINAEILSLSAAIKHHIAHAAEHSKVPSVTKNKCVKQIVGLLAEIRKLGLDEGFNFGGILAG